MAVQPTTLDFADLRIYVEDPNNLGSYIAPCGFTQRSFSIKGTTSKAVVPFCDDPTLIPATRSAKGSREMTVDGDGILAMEALPVWQHYADSGSFPARVEFAASGANNGGYYQVNMNLTDFTVDAAYASEAGLAKAKIALENDGAWVWNKAA